jgi:hypothetical protein
MTLVLGASCVDCVVIVADRKITDLITKSLVAYGDFKYFYVNFYYLNTTTFTITYIGLLGLVLSFITIPSISNTFSIATTTTTAYAQSSGNTTTTTSTITTNNTTKPQEPGQPNLQALKSIVAALKIPTSALDIKMAQLATSNKSEDIATLAYIWGYPLITMQRSFNYFTSPNSPPGTGHGPSNEIHCARKLITSNDTDVVAPNSDTLYCIAWLDLKNEPLVLKVPPIPDRYYTFEFLDGYTNVYAYVGQRESGSSGGTYLIAGPEWKGEVPNGMTKIWSPTNLAWILQRTLVKGSADVPNVHAIQDKISLTPLSTSQGNIPSTSPSQQQPTAATGSNASSTKQVPIAPQPALIPTTGIKIYDEIGKAIIGNPLNPPDPGLVTKLASIGIGPGKVPSTEANDTVKTALQTGITEGEKLISAKVANAGTKNNGWLINTQTGVYGDNYLFRAAVTKLGFGANIAQEAFYPPTFTDSEGKPLSGNNNYVIHFKPGQIPPVDAFWSITLYNDKSYFVNNPINRYNVGKYTEGLKNNTDGSLDIYIQNASPGKDKESNWLPSPPQGAFNFLMRLYLPQAQALNGTWSPPPVQRMG